MAKARPVTKKALVDESKVIPQFVMLPHDICASLFQSPGVFHHLLTGTPGDIDSYWQNNQDLWQKVMLPGTEPHHQYEQMLLFSQTFQGELFCRLRDPSWWFLGCLLTSKDQRRFIPFRVYGDGADSSQPFELFSILPVLCSSSSTLDGRLVTAVRNTHQSHDSTRDKILGVIAWSFQALRCSLEN